MIERILFARIGWMKFYRGQQSDDDRPIGGGAWNEEHVGHELENFLPDGLALFGFVESGGKGVNLHRIELNTSGGAELDDVTVIWVSTNPETGGQWVIGWYKRATVFEQYQRRGRSHQAYLIRGEVGNSCLLPPDRRRYRIPSGTGGFGQANLCYPLEENGVSKGLSWMNEVLAYVHEYEGPNLLTDPLAAAEADFEHAFEAVRAAVDGQRFGGTAEERKAVEGHAMRRAQEFFEALGYTVDPSVHKRKPYDLLCVKRRHRLCVEVKGTQGGPESVILTPGEVRHVSDVSNLCALYVLHGIKLSGRGSGLRATGGAERIFNPWQIGAGVLEPISYNYRLPTD